MCDGVQISSYIMGSLSFSTLLREAGTCSLIILLLPANMACCLESAGPEPALHLYPRHKLVLVSVKRLDFILGPGCSSGKTLSLLNFLQITLAQASLGLILHFYIRGVS